MSLTTPRAVRIGKHVSQTDKYFLGVLFIALAARLIAIPFSQPDEADGYSHIRLAEDWMRYPYLITHGVWGPLDTYLVAFSLFIWHNRVYAPLVLNCILSAATAIPLYLFVKREWNEGAALFTASLYLVYCVAFRYGLVALSDVPFIFFIALGMWILSCARAENGTVTQAALAGVIVTAAGALRYEAWMLIPFFGLILWKKWRSMVVFFATALIFPVFWMIGNYFGYGDPLYSIHSALNWNLNVTLQNANIKPIDYANRATYFARDLFFGLTPLAFLACLCGAFLVLYHRRKQWVWLIPLIGLFGISTINTINGNSVFNFRFSLSVAILFIPFAAEWFDDLKNLRRRWLYSWAVIISMIPLAFITYMVSWPRYFPSPMPPKPAYLPRFDAETVHESEVLNREIGQYPGGLILDFHDWRTTYYFALTSNNATWHIFILPGEKNEQLDLPRLNAFIDSNPQGMLLATSKPRFFEIACAGNQCSLRFKGRDQILHANEVGHSGDDTIYRYSTNATIQ